MVEVGSTQLHSSLNYYGYVWSILADFQGHWNKLSVRKALNLQPVPAFGTETLTAAAAAVANQSNTPFPLSHFLGFLNDVKFLNTDRLPPVRISIRWVSNAVCAGGTAATGATYSISGLYALVDMVKLGAIYDSLLSEQITVQNPLQIPYTNYQVIPGIQGNLTNIVRWASTSDSLQKVYATFVPSDYQSFKTVDPVTFLSQNFTRGSPILKNGMTSRYTINGNSFPDIPLEAKRGEIMQHTLESFNKHHDVTSQPHPNLNTLDRFNTNFFLHGCSFTYDSDGGDAAASRKCGLSGLGNNLIGSWETNYTGAIAGADTSSVLPLVVLETKAVLEIAPARAVLCITLNAVLCTQGVVHTYQ